MDNGGAQSPKVEDHPGKPQCSSNSICATQQDCGTHQRSFLVASYVEHRGRIRAILSSLPIGEIRPPEEGGSAAANPTTRTEVVVDHYIPDYGFAKV